MTLKLVRKSDHVTVADHVIIADRFFLRLKGLIGKKNFVQGEGMLFPRCNNIHMWMMSVSIDVLFLKKQSSESWSVLDCKQNLKPWKALPVACFAADDTLELPSGTVKKMDLKAGEVLCIA